MSRAWGVIVVLALGIGVPPVACASDNPGENRARELSRHLRSQVGKASIYAKKFANRRMANGRRMDPNDSNAASKTLPLGTRARVTNLQTGKSAVVTIEDRGPYVRGRIVDLSPATAEQIGLGRKQGIAPVEVTPLEE
jgi:rare lipoprotein A